MDTATPSSSPCALVGSRILERPKWPLLILVKQEDLVDCKMA